MKNINMVVMEEITLSYSVKRQEIKFDKGGPLWIILHKINLKVKVNILLIRCKSNLTIII